MRSLTFRAGIVSTALLLLAACADAGVTPSGAMPDLGSPSGITTASPTVGPTAAATPTATPTADASTSTPAPTSDGLGAFTCELPITEQATVRRANITDVRVGTHSGYDRFVVEFSGGTPEIVLERAEPPFLAPGSGSPVQVRGESFLHLRMPGGTRQTESGESSYDGPTEFTRDFPQLVHVIEAGDFEAQGEWYLGLRSEACVRVFFLDEPHRLVIDVEH